MDSKEHLIQESPEYLRMSLAAAMTLGFKPGIFYRDAKLYCINLLLTYTSGCSARCGYCGLSNKRAGEYNDKSFIRVTWPTYALYEIILAISKRLKQVKRICISQVTNLRCIEDTTIICQQFRKNFDVPISLLISPTIVGRENLLDFKNAGADKVGVAIDLASPRLFNKFRGKGVGGPHTWERYIDCLESAISIFGRKNAGSHFIIGMGETEKEIIQAMQMIQDMGGWTHLFSFYPESDSPMKDHPMPQMDHYRRIQLARYLIDKGLSKANLFSFNEKEQIINFGLSTNELNSVIDSGQPFRTSGCEGYDGEVACNRPFANSRPGPNIRNFPFPPNEKDIKRIRFQMGKKYEL